MTRHTPNWLQAGQYSAAWDRDLIGALWPSPAAAGAAVTVASGMTVNVAPGQIAVPTPNNTGSVLCTSDAVEQVVLAAAPASGVNRYDLVTCQARGNDLDGGANNDFIFTSVTGVAVASPVPPAVPAGAVALAQIYIPGGSAAITAGNIVDRRPFGLAVARSVHARVHFTGGVFGTVLGLVAAQARDDDALGLYNPATGLFTCPLAGFYQCQALINGSPLNAGQWLGMQFARNAAPVSPPQYFTAPTASSGAPLYGGFPIRCAAGDTLALWAAAQVAGVNINAAQNFLAFDLIGTG